MISYNWQHPNWPHFEYDLSDVQDLLHYFIVEASHLAGGLEQLSDQIQ